MGKSKKKWERVQKKRQKVKDNTEKRKLKKQIRRLIDLNKMSEVGFLMQKYKSKFGDLNETSK